MRPTSSAVPNPARAATRVAERVGAKLGTGPARYTVVLVGLGATGVALGWLGSELAASSGAVTRRR